MKILNQKPNTFLIFALTFLLLFMIGINSWASILGVLFCLSIFAYFESIKISKDSGKSDYSTSETKDKNELISQSVYELQDRVGRLELALGLKGAAANQQL